MDAKTAAFIDKRLDKSGQASLVRQLQGVSKAGEAAIAALQSALTALQAKFPVQTADIGDSQVTSAKILDGTIVGADIAAATVTVDKLAGVPCVRVYRSSNQSINNNTTTAITFNSERYDTEGIHSTSSNTSRLTAQTAGVYCISVNVSWDSSANGYRELDIRMNGSTYIAGTLRNTNGLAEGSLHAVTTDYYLGVGDYVEAMVFQNSGGSLDIQSSSAYSPEFMMHWVSP